MIVGRCATADAVFLLCINQSKQNIRFFVSTAGVPEESAEPQRGVRQDQLPQSLSVQHRDVGCQAVTQEGQITVLLIKQFNFKLSEGVSFLKCFSVLA